MRMESILNLFKPNLAVLGYALFLTVNASGVWGGVFPFLPLEFQTPINMFWFFLAHSLVFSLCFWTSAVNVYLFNGSMKRYAVLLASVPCFLGWSCLIAAVYLPLATLQFMIIGGALLGFSSAYFFMLWEQLFAGFEAKRGARDLIVGTAWASLLYFSLYAIPRAVTAYLIPAVFLPLFALAVYLAGKKVDGDQAMFIDVPKEHPQVYRAAVRDYGRIAVCIGMVGFCAGIMRVLSISEPSMGSLVNILSMGATLVATVGLMIAWRYKNINLNVLEIFRIVFPFIMTSLVLMPFLSSYYEKVVAALLYAAYSVSTLLMMIQCVQAARDRGINPVFMYGFFGGIVYILYELGFLAGSLSETVAFTSMDPLVVATLLGVYLLSMIHFLGYGGLRGALKETLQASTIELVKLAPQTAVVSEATLSDAQSESPGIDPLSARCATAQAQYQLTAREAEIMELVARGNTVARIAEDLVVSENTIRYHTKNIYAKLGIHKKQELVDLLNAANDCS